jgi:hypothetical protein
MKPVVYLASVLLILFALMLAISQLPKTPAPRLDQPSLAQAVEINWGEGMEVKWESTGVEDTQLALK